MDWNGDKDHIIKFKETVEKLNDKFLVSYLEFIIDESYENYNKLYESAAEEKSRFSDELLKYIPICSKTNVQLLSRDDFLKRIEDRAKQCDFLKKKMMWIICRIF